MCTYRVIHWSTIGLYIGRLSVDCRSTVGRLSVDCRPIVGWLPTDSRPIVDRYIGRLSAYMSTEATYSTHDPTNGKRDKACNLMAASRDLLYFKLELTPNYWKSLPTVDGCWSMRCCSISLPNLSFISKTFSEKIDAEIMNTAFLI